MSTQDSRSRLSPKHHPPMPKPTPQPKPVTCATCRHFVRDTSGPSYNIYTHTYFMGTCTLALTPHSPIKQFADHPHICPHHQPN